MGTTRAPFIRSPYNYDVKAVSDECVVCNDQPSLTVQSQADDGDINVLMKRFGVTGVMPSNPRVPRFGDFIGINDFASALQAVSDAQDKFNEFPAEVRARFGNNPQKLLEFVSNDANMDEAERLGLIRKEARRERSVSQDVGVAAQASAQRAGGDGTAAGVGQAAQVADRGSGQSASGGGQRPQ